MTAKKDAPSDKQPEPANPAEGGSYVRDPATGHTERQGQPIDNKRGRQKPPKEAAK